MGIAMIRVKNSKFFRLVWELLLSCLTLSTFRWSRGLIWAGTFVTCHPLFSPPSLPVSLEQYLCEVCHTEKVELFSFYFPL